MGIIEGFGFWNGVRKERNGLMLAGAGYIARYTDHVSIYIVEYRIII